TTIFTRCLWSNVESPRSARRLRQSCAIVGGAELVVVVWVEELDCPLVVVEPWVVVEPCVTAPPPSAESSSIDFEYVYNTVAVNPLCNLLRNCICAASRVELPFDVRYSNPTGQ